MRYEVYAIGDDSRVNADTFQEAKSLEEANRLALDLAFTFPSVIIQLVNQ